MPSNAAIRFRAGVERSEKILDLVGSSRLRPQSRDESVNFSHAALASLVAAWDTYLNTLIDEFYTSILDPTDPKFHSLYTVAKNNADRAKKKFNTPNYENSRNLLIELTGFDPLPVWVWTDKSMTPLLVNERLNEILKVRHSFAHGFSIPPYSWAASRSGRVVLRVDAVRFVRSFFIHLVTETDIGMSRFLAQNYQVHVIW
jgi:hypothetical protein